MERNANYALVGLVSVLLAIGLLVFVVWLGGSQFNNGYDRYDVVFQGPVRGLAQGGEVHFNGIKVGEVSHVSLDKQNPQLVIARIRIDSDIPVRADSVGVLEPQGITGVNYIQISAGSASKPLLRDTVPEGTIPRLRTERDALSDLLQGSGSVIQKTVQALDQVNKVFSDENVKTVSATLSDVQALTAELRAHKSVIADAQKTLQGADQAAVQIRDLAKSSETLVNGDGKKALAKIGAAAEELEGATSDLRTMLAKIQGPTADFAATGLPQLTNAIGSLQRAADHLDRVLTDVSADPRGALEKPPAKQIEVKP